MGSGSLDRATRHKMIAGGEEFEDSLEAAGRGAAGERRPISELCEVLPCSPCEPRSMLSVGALAVEHVLRVFGAIRAGRASLHSAAQYPRSPPSDKALVN